MKTLQEIVHDAKAGNGDAMLEILQRYMKLIDSQSHIDGVLNEDLKQTIIETVIHAVHCFKG